MISFDRISIELGGRQILENVSLNIEEGEVFCIVGRSGVGKSVMIKQLVGLLHPDEGSIRFRGREVVGMSETDLQQLRKECGMVFQHATLFDSMSCVENVALPIRLHQGVKHHKARERALRYMAEVGIEHLAEKDPATLGPGLRKLVAIARTLTLEPDAILFDEPTTGLDPLAARKFDQLVTGTLAGTNMTQVVVSHDVRSIFDIANKIAMLHEGRVRFLGTPEELESSEDQVVRDFILGQPGEE